MTTDKSDARVDTMGDAIDSPTASAVLPSMAEAARDMYAVLRDIEEYAAAIDGLSGARGIRYEFHYNSGGRRPRSAAR